MRLVLVMMAFAIPAAAQPKTTLEMRYLRGENLHIANQGGAINWHDEMTLKLELLAGGKLTGKETGKAREHNLYENNSTSEEVYTWTHTWSGTWKRSGDALALDVVLDARVCTHTKQYGNGPLDQLPCGTVTKQIQLACASRQVEIGLGKPTQKRDVWQCLPKGTPSMDRTPTPWTFARIGCVKTLGGRSRFSYEKC